jgi:hypothetical protein
MSLVFYRMVLRVEGDAFPNRKRDLFLSRLLSSKLENRRQDCGDIPFLSQLPGSLSELPSSLSAQAEVSKAEDHQAQTGKDRRRDQPVQTFLQAISRANRTPSTDSRLLNLAISLA